MELECPMPQTWLWPQNITNEKCSAIVETSFIENTGLNFFTRFAKDCDMCIIRNKPETIQLGSLPIISGYPSCHVLATKCSWEEKCAYCGKWQPSFCKEECRSHGRVTWCHFYPQYTSTNTQISLMKPSSDFRAKSEWMPRLHGTNIRCFFTQFPNDLQFHLSSNCAWCQGLPQIHQTGDWTFIFPPYIYNTEPGIYLYHTQPAIWQIFGRVVCLKGTMYSIIFIYRLLAVLWGIQGPVILWFRQPSKLG